MRNHEDMVRKSLNRSFSKLTPDIQSVILQSANKEKRFVGKEKRIIFKIASSIAISYLVFFVIINTLPVSAQILSKIPYVDKLVWSSVIDKGIFQAVDDGFVQPIHEFVTDKELTFSVHDVVIGNKIHFLLSVVDLNRNYSNDIESLSIVAKDQNGDNLSFTSKLPYYDALSGAYIFDCNIIVPNQKDLKELSNINLKVSSIKFDNNSEVKGSWEIDVQIQQDGINSLLIETEINEEIVNEDGTSFLLKKIISSPADVSVYIVMDSKDSRKAPRTVHIISPDGEKIPMINAFAQQNDDVTTFIYYFNSIYPSTPIKMVYSDGEAVKEVNLE